MLQQRLRSLYEVDARSWLVAYLWLVASSTLSYASQRKDLDANKHRDTTRRTDGKF